MSRVLSLTTPHMHGEDVKRLQTLLNTQAYLHAAIDGKYGPMTAQAVYRAKYWLGYPKPDQVAGDLFLAYLKGKKTTARMRVYASLRRRKAKKASLTPLILVEARKHLGTKESPPGSNKVFFSTWYGITGSWCAMFVSYCGVRANLKSFKRGSQYAYVPFIVADARAGRNNLTLVHPLNVRPGDIVCYDWPGESRGTADHVGIFEKWLVKGSSFAAIEGNTGIGNDSNGGEVMRRERSVSTVIAFVRAH